MDSLNNSLVKNSSEQEWDEYLLWILTLLFPVFMPIQHGVSAISYFMGLISLYVVIKKRPKLSPISKYLLTSFVLLFAVSWVSLLNAEDIENGINRLKWILHFLVLLPILPAIATVRKNLALPFLIGSSIGGIVVFCIAIYQAFFLDYARVTGFYNIIMFGTMAVIIALAIFIGLFFAKGNRAIFIFLFFSLGCTLYAAILSGTRGAWIGFLGGAPLGLFLMIKALPKKRLIQISILSILIFVFVGIIGSDMIAQRWETTNYYMKIHKKEQSKITNIGARFLMWRAAFRMWSRNPILGTGIGDFQNDFKKMVNKGDIELQNSSLIAHPYAHNIFLDSLSGTGILGFLVMVGATIVIPLIFFFKSIDASSDWNLYAAVFGVVFIVAFLLFGLTENWLAHKQLVLTYSLLLAIMGSRFALKK
jgi:O-antigen ligase